MNDLDAVFDALADDHRRHLLLGLLEQEPQYVPELTGATKEVAEANTSFIDDCLASGTDIPDVDTRLLRIHHVHLPKLAEYDFIDRDANLVLRGRRFEELRPVLELLAEPDREGVDRELSVR